MAITKCPLMGHNGCTQGKCEVWSNTHQKCSLRLLENIVKAIENVNQKEEK